MAAAGVSRALPGVEAMAVLGSSTSATWSEPGFADVAVRVSGLGSCAGPGFCAGRLPTPPRPSSSWPVSAHALLLRRRNRESVRGQCARRAVIVDGVAATKGWDTARGVGGGAAPPRRRSKIVVLAVRPAAQFDTAAAAAAETVVVSPPKSPPAAADVSPPKSPAATGQPTDDRSGPVEISGPIDLDLDLEIDPFAFPKANPLQTAGSVLLTGAIALLLLRSLRRRTKNAKRVRFRSDRTVEVGKENPNTLNPDPNSASLAAGRAAESNPPAAEPPPASNPPTALGTFSGALVAAGIAYLLYKFTLGVEGGFAKQSVSANYSVRNLTITVRTIIAGLCYLATFVFAANSIGLMLYAFQLLLGLNPSDAEGSNKEGGGSLQGSTATLQEAESDQLSNAKSGDDDQTLSK
ncbi:hypothetical protein CBR_g28819 [Chara braunii]|uniref:DUF3082 domain-containing protein n=1 Tax=Chara braunii TaxID=69332 RepID=A0A388L9Z5_CHABU|nr:hypothetical protein CBR_g28819 [Chara braunii]|eukprot:GBG79104.1 hypothetical protein CBR_g28819 [Chara braunii]